MMMGVKGGSAAVPQFCNPETADWWKTVAKSFMQVCLCQILSDNDVIVEILSYYNETPSQNHKM